MNLLSPISTFSLISAFAFSVTGERGFIRYKQSQRSKQPKGQQHDKSEFKITQDERRDHTIGIEYCERHQRDQPVEASGAPPAPSLAP